MEKRERRSSFFLYPLPPSLAYPRDELSWRANYALRHRVRRIIIAVIATTMDAATGARGTAIFPDDKTIMAGLCWSGLGVSPSISQCVAHIIFISHA